MKFWRVFPSILLASFLLGLISAAHAGALIGGWKGTWTKNGDALPVVVRFEQSRNGYAGSFGSDALQVLQIPFSGIAFAAPKVHFELKGDQSTSIFDGTLAGDALSGTFVDGDTKGTFRLARAALSPDTVAAHDVTFRNGNVTLAGTLLILSTPGRHPAFLFLQGSGPEGRWANRYLAERFAQQGIAALIFDKRGVGQSTGDWQKETPDDLVGDAIAGVHFLQEQSQIDPSKVGVYGHSQDGTLAGSVAARVQNLGFVIGSAAGGIDPGDMEIYSVENSNETAKLPPDERDYANAYIGELVAVAYHGRSRTHLDAMAARFKTRSWYFDPPSVGNYYWSFSRQLEAFHPVEAWRQVRANVLLVYGAHDERVPPVASAKAIEGELARGGNAHVTLHLFPNADHTFTIVSSAKPNGWPKREPGYADFLTNWVRSFVFKSDVDPG